MKLLYRCNGANIKEAINVMFPIYLSVLDCMYASE